MLERISGRFGRRGTWLIVLGCVWIAHGVGHLLEPVVTRVWVLHTHIPTPMLAGMWAVTGVIAIIEGLRGRGREDWLGHAALYLMPAIKVFSFGMAWLLWLVDRVFDVSGDMGWSGGWYAALVWLIVSVALRLVASWPNPDRPILAPPPRDVDEKDPGR